MVKETYERIIIDTAKMAVISIPKIFLEQKKFQIGDRVTVTIEKKGDK